jgi:integrase
LFAILEAWCLLRQKFKFLFDQQGRAADTVLNALKLVATTLSLSLLDCQSHMLRRGTASCLESLGIRSELLNLHMGWTVQSTMRHVYRRPILLLQIDRDFFWDICQQNKS